MTDQPTNQTTDQTTTQIEGISQEREILSDHIKFTKYDLDITPNFSDFTFNCQETIVFYVSRNTNNIILNCKDIRIERCVIVYDNEIYTADSIKYNTETVDVHINGTLEPKVGLHGTMFVSFTGQLNDNLCGFYRTKYIVGSDNEPRYAGTTQFESHDARRAFLCADEPGSKATFSLTLNVPNDLTALSNTPVSHTQTCVWDKSMKTVRFEPTPVMSSYLVAWYVGELEHVETTCTMPNSNAAVRIRTYTTPGKKEQAKYANDFAAKTLVFFSEYFDIDYPLAKLDQIAVPDFAAGAMENWGLVTYRETFVLCDDFSTSQFQKMQIASTIAHELAHQWFGNLVTPLWWNDLWLKEGFATYVGWLAVNEFHPEWLCWEYFVAERYQRALALDELESSHPINNDVKRVSQIDEIFDAISYLKGASMLRMLAEWLGEENFKIGLRSYLKQFKYQNAVTEDLWEHLSKASNKDVSDVMNGWINQKGYPIVTVSKNRYNQYLFSQQPYGGEPTDRRIWKIPLHLCWKNDDPALSDMILEENWSCVNIDEDQELIKANMNRTGFYRVHYHPSMDPVLKLRISNKTFSTLDRSEIFAGMFDLAKRGYDNTTRALELLDCYSDDTDYLVWSEIVQRLNVLKKAWISYPSVVAAIDNWLVDRLKPQLISLGWDFGKEDTYQVMKMRQLVISTLAGIGEASVLETCRQCFKEFVESPNELSSSMNSNVRQSVLVSVVRHSETGEEIDQLKNVYPLIQSPEIKVEILKAMGCTMDSLKLIEVLDYSFTSGYVRVQDMTYVLLMLDTDITFVAWKYITDNWERILKIFGNGGMGLMNFLVCAPLSNLSGDKELEDAKEFLENHATDIESIKTSINQQLEKINKDREWFKRDEKTVVEWAKKLIIQQN